MSYYAAIIRKYYILLVIKIHILYIVAFITSMHIKLAFIDELRKATKTFNQDKL